MRFFSGYFAEQVFNVGNRRRIASKGDNRNGTSHSHAFFDPKNTAAKEIRDELALESLEELIAWLKQGGRVGIHGTTDISQLSIAHHPTPLCFFYQFHPRITSFSYLRPEKCKEVSDRTI